LNFRDRFKKNTHTKILKQIRPLGAKWFHAGGGQTDITKQIVPFRNTANAPKKKNNA
jgi:hypothetical protein